MAERRNSSGLNGKGHVDGEEDQREKNDAFLPIKKRRVIMEDDATPESSHSSGYELLFTKALPDSAVTGAGKLVIPKGVAKAHFPAIQVDENNNGYVMIQIEDEKKRSFQMKLSFHGGSSRMFMVQNGWREFVNKHNLKVNDKVSFYRTKNSKCNKCYGITVERAQQVRDDAVQSSINYQPQDSHESEISEDSEDDTCDPDYEPDHSE